MRCPCGVPVRGMTRQPPRARRGPGEGRFVETWPGVNGTKRSSAQMTGGRTDRTTRASRSMEERRRGRLSMGSADERGQVERLVDVRLVLGWRPAGPVGLDGAGMLLFPTLESTPGLYRLMLPPVTVGRGRLYIGETDNLRRRLAGNYRRPGPTQTTSLRINSLLCEHLNLGGSVQLVIATTVDVQLNGQPPQPLELTHKASRLLAENAALVHARATEDVDFVNL